MDKQDFDDLTDLVDHAQNAQPVEPVAITGDERQVINSQGEHITLDDNKKAQ